VRDRKLLISRHHELLSTYNGQVRIQVVWSRLIFPDGASINLEGMAGQDASGHAGLRHDVDNHYKRLVGFGLLTSVFSAAPSALADAARERPSDIRRQRETTGSAVAGLGATLLLQLA
jgi:type IV secretory pathway VirB10-like protein